MTEIRSKVIHWFHQPLVGPMIANPTISRLLLIACCLQVMTVWLWGVGMPCPVPVVFGIPCPGCGLTRGVIYLFQGRFSAAMWANPFALLAVCVGVVFLIAFPMGPRTRGVVAHRISAIESATCLPAIALVLIHIYWMLNLVYAA
ncbi:MAG: DUF2752 domain-containing protein [Burkholderiales bacterium]|nr:DUF2752 domain-containing protein [Phycisphaerae bacterium]